MEVQTGGLVVGVASGSLLPSLRSGLAALEGIACGAIPIATHQGGLVDAVGACGPLFPPEDVDALYEHLTALESDEALRDAYLCEHPKHLKAHQPESIARAYLGEFRSAINMMNEGVLNR